MSKSTQKQQRSWAGIKMWFPPSHVPNMLPKIKIGAKPWKRKRILVTAINQVEFIESANTSKPVFTHAHMLSVM